MAQTEKPERKVHKISDARPDIGEKASDLVGAGPVIILSVRNTQDWGTPPRTMVLFMVEDAEGGDPRLFHTSSPAIVRDLTAARKAAAFPLEVSFEWKRTQGGFQTLVFAED